VAAILLLGAPAAAAGEAEELVQRVEQRHAGLRSMSASFTQAYRSVATGQEIVERGRVFVQRPLLRFDYRKPSKKVFLVEADGTTLAYVPADRSAVKARIPDDAPHLRLLRGDSGLLEDFSARVVELKKPAVVGSVQLKLTPRRPLHDVDLAYLEVDGESGAIHRVLVLDAMGNESDLLLHRVKENPRLGGSVFRLDLPGSVALRDLTQEQGR
jgi:outer membrane lipoprotein-sorting protein